VTGDERWRWLESTRRLQEEAFGVNFSERQEGGKLADNLVHQGFALIIELAEAFGEIQWKDWAKNRGQHNRDAVVGELVDVGHFLANLLVHFDVTDDEWERLYQAKQGRNRARQATAGGYDNVKSKCPGCKRELDKPGSTLWDSHWLMLVCSACSALIGSYAAGTRESKFIWRDEVDSEAIWVAQNDADKCPGCKRGLGDLGVVCAIEDDDGSLRRSPVMCAHCSTPLGSMGYQDPGKIDWLPFVDKSVIKTVTACTCQSKGIGRPRRDPDCLAHPMNRNDQGIPILDDS
jgi:dUTPase